MVDGTVRELYILSTECVVKTIINNNNIKLNEMPDQNVNAINGMYKCTLVIGPDSVISFIIKKQQINECFSDFFFFFTICLFLSCCVKHLIQPYKSGQISGKSRNTGSYIMTFHITCKIGDVKRDEL